MQFIHKAKIDSRCFYVVLYMQITVKWQGRIGENARQHESISSSPPLFHSTVSVQWNCSSFYYGLQLIKDVIKDVQVCLKDLSLVFLMHAQTHSLSPSISVSLALSVLQRHTDVQMRCKETQAPFWPPVISEITFASSKQISSGNQLRSADQKHQHWLLAIPHSNILWW